MEEDGDLELSIYQATGNKLAGNVLEVLLNTSRGLIQGLLHPVEGKLGAVLWLGGANGDMNGPAGGLFVELSHELVDYGVTSFRVRYRQPGNYQECVLDALAGVSFLTGIGATRIALVGHSFGGSVAIAAGAFGKAVTAVVALSSQNAGTHLVPDIAPRQLLLVHGRDDTEVSPASSEDIYRRAQEPKQLVILPKTRHGLMEARSEVADLLMDWLGDKVGSRPWDRAPHKPAPGPIVRPVLVDSPPGLVVREIALFQGNLADLEADAIVCPTNDQLWMGDGVALRVFNQGGEEILWEAQRYAPAEMGSATVLGGGHLKARHVILTVTGTSAFPSRRPNEVTIRTATRNCLKRASELQLRSIAFPSLGTGAGGFPYEKAAHVMLEEVVEHLKGDGGLEKVIFVLYVPGALRAFEEALKQYG